MKNNIAESDFLNLIQNEVNESAAVTQEIILPNNTNGVKVFLKREDLLHETISGNKWRKLKYNLIEANRLGVKTLLTFGGAFSNHIHATASAGKIFGFNTIGIIRGEEHFPLNPTLDFAKNCGMIVHYMDRKTYRKKNEINVIDLLKHKYGNFYLVPEGGTNNLAVKGCTEIIDDINIDFDIILTACGTGGTISGLICGLSGEKKVVGIPVLKGAEFLINDTKSLVKDYSNQKFNNWELNLNFHFGGYAKINKELIEFILEFEKLNNIKLDPIYTGKLLFAINKMVGNKNFESGKKLLALHTGGLQGIAGMKNKIKKLLS